MKRVELVPIQQAVSEYLAKDHTWKDLCESLEWMQTPTKPESVRLQRALGLRAYARRKVRGKQEKKQRTNTKMNHDTAVKIIRAIGRAPREFDL